ncbi:MAG TPA: thioredoxin [Candidatus Saccharimonadaceae bacterium]|jgi:thioredoxin 1|nr:thioredoxin [Candidatus Saccharimonadaceae bacterium]
MGNAVAVSSETFEDEVLKAGTAVLVDFWAPWCGPCRAIAPVVEQLAMEYSGRLKVVKVNTDENDAIAIQYQVMSIPTLMVFKGGQLVERIVGAVPKPSLLAKITPHL